MEKAEQVLVELSAACQDTKATVDQIAAYELTDWQVAVAQVAVARLVDVQMELMKVLHDRREQV